MMMFTSLESFDDFLARGREDEDIYGVVNPNLVFHVLLPQGLYQEVQMQRHASVTELLKAVYAISKHSYKDVFSDIVGAPEEYIQNYYLTYLDQDNSFKELENADDLVSNVISFMSVLKLIKRTSAGQPSLGQTKESVRKLIYPSTAPKLSDMSLADEARLFSSDSKEKCMKWYDQAKNTAAFAVKYMCAPQISVLETSSCSALLDRIMLCNEKGQFTVHVHVSQLCQQLYNITAFHLIPCNTETSTADLIIKLLPNSSPANICLLKICGREEYLTDDNALSASDETSRLWYYKYVAKMLMRKHHPELILMRLSEVDPNLEKPRVKPRLPSSRNLSEKGHTISRVKRKIALDLFDIQQCFKITITKLDNLKYLSDKRKPKAKIKIGLYHGIESLCDPLESRELTIDDQRLMSHDSQNPILFEGYFDIQICDLPRNAKLCFSLIHRGRVESKSYWCNMSIFDYQRRLIDRKKMLCMWQWPADDMRQDFNHLGTNVDNPERDAPHLYLHFDGHLSGDEICLPVLYPDQEKLIHYHADQMSPDEDNKESIDTVALRSLIEKDRLFQLHEQDKCCIRDNAYYIMMNHADALPLVLVCLRWSSRDDVAKACNLLMSWKWDEVSVDTALELLDCMYADQNVRSYAVKRLRTLKLSDSYLCRYLLQLVQALKYESYLNCKLIWYLLERAVYSKMVGHQFFWLLKSEMHVPSVQVWFGLIMEAYCHSRVDHVPQLIEQSVTLEVVHNISNHIKIISKGAAFRSKDALKGSAQDKLRMEKHKLSKPTTVLTPSWKLGALLLDQCSPKDSKMRPLQLVWKNQDCVGSEMEHGDTGSRTIQILFKHGDDLRQDMLTLQIIQIMDDIWISQGYDFRMNIYGCVAAGQNSGVIEIVKDSSTVANIQRLYGGVGDKYALLKWLQNNNEPDSMDEVIEEFTLSCVGYCVATCILGIGDRHNDNIMMKTNGQFFHIDFGHFLGHFKKYLGVQYERVPFVFTSHFAAVIQATKRHAKPMERFDELCCEAFLLIRRKGSHLVSLFMMMLSTGIPELKSTLDLDYLRKMLMLDKNDEEARRSFMSKIKHVKVNQELVLLKWRLHLKKRDNT